MKQYPINQVFLLLLLVIVWYSPQIVSSWGLQIALALVGGFLLAQLFIMAIQWVLLRYGVNRMGIVVLSSALALCGISMMYYAWRESNYSMLNISWMFVYTSVGVIQAVRTRNLNYLRYNIILYFEYLFIAFFAAAVFSQYINESTIALLDLEYSGIQAETVWFVAMVILLCQIVHSTLLILSVQYKKIIKR